MPDIRLCLALIVAPLRAAPRVAWGQQPAPSRPDTTATSGLAAGEADAERPRRQLLSAARMDLGFTTLSIGAGVLVD